MYLSPGHARELLSLGFKRSYYEDEVAPFDVYQYQEEEWIVGGRILPEQQLAVDSVIYREGSWLPTMHDLLYWLVDNNYSVDLQITEKIKGFKVEVSDVNGNVYSSKGGTVELALHFVICSILKDQQT